mmetsp:Transcript_7533/g.11180  ORF Transcript_7533/g.11180 Transcript_7533/m.11180 type:complete len:325 (-) Transcript_7533:46-1020(-)
MSDSEKVNQLVSQFPNIDVEVIKYILTEVSGGNEQIAASALKGFDNNAIEQVKIAIKNSKGNVELSSQQKEDIMNFKQISGASESIALKYLKNNAWNLMEAMNNFYESGMVDTTFSVDNKSTENIDQESFLTIYERLKSLSGSKNDDLTEKDLIVFECMLLEKDFTNSGEVLSDFSVLLVAQHLCCQNSPMIITKDEFIKNIKDSLGCSSLPALREKVKTWKEEIESKRKFKEFYKFAFLWASKNNNELDATTAIKLWRLLVAEKKYCQFSNLMIYFEKDDTVITKDIWIQTLEFLEIMDLEFEEYDEDDMWPSVLDSFVTSQQ